MTLLSIAFSTLAADGPPPSGEDDVQAWVRAARAGDREAARRIYEAYAAKVYRTVRPLCVSDAEAEDVMQDAFAKAFEALDRYQAREGARFVSWLLTIALNLARRLRRRGVRERPLSPERLAELSEGGMSPTLDAALDRATLRSALLEALATTLTDREREVITLLYGGELTSAEVAELTGTSSANARKIAQRAREALKVALERRLRPRRQSVEDRP